MLVFYREKKYLIISLVALLLDGILVYVIPYYFNNINIWYPMLTISLLPFLLYDDMKSYYKLCFFIGLLYDLLYSNIFLVHAFIFLLLGKVNSKIMKVLKNNLGLYIFLVILNIIIYDTFFFILMIITKYQVVSISDVIYKIKNSIILNILSSLIYYFLVRKRNY